MIDESSPECSYLNGRRKNIPSRRSILFFTIHKAGSTYANSLLAGLAGSAGLQTLDFERYFYLGGKFQGKSFLSLAEKLSLFAKSGYYFGPLRHFDREGLHPPILEIECSAIPLLAEFDVVVLLRDPRDVLVSFFYSMAYSHAVPDNPEAAKRLLAKRQQALGSTIDEFCLANVPRFLPIYRHYLRYLKDLPNVLLLRYEDMVLNFGDWLSRIEIFLNIPVGSPIPPNERRISENIYEHKRQVLPGDHVKKLAPSTITLLNREFADILESLGYVTPLLNSKQC